MADKYDSMWSSLTRQFIPYLIDIAQIVPGMSVLDVACGPGYVSNALRKIGAIPMGIDFSGKMVAIARRRSPGFDSPRVMRKIRHVTMGTLIGY